MILRPRFVLVVFMNPCFRQTGDHVTYIWVAVKLKEIPDIADVITSVAESGVPIDDQDKVGLSSMVAIGQSMVAMIAHVNEQVDTKVDTPFPAYLRGRPELFSGIQELGIVLATLLDRETMVEGCDQTYHYMYAKLKYNSACLGEAFFPCQLGAKQRATCQLQ